MPQSKQTGSNDSRKNKGVLFLKNLLKQSSKHTFFHDYVNYISNNAYYKKYKGCSMTYIPINSISGNIELQ